MGWRLQILCSDTVKVSGTTDSVDLFENRELESPKSLRVLLCQPLINVGDWDSLLGSRNSAGGALVVRESPNFWKSSCFGGDAGATFLNLGASLDDIVLRGVRAPLLLSTVSKAELRLGLRIERTSRGRRVQGNDFRAYRT